MRRNKLPLTLLTLGAISVCSLDAHAVDPFERTGTHAKGDFDNDGEIDLVASSPQADCNKGAIYVLMGAGGSASWTKDTSGILGTAACDDYFGAALAVGDFNGDDYDDLAIGAPGSSEAGPSASGSVHILYGSASGLTDTGDQLWHQETAGIDGVAATSDQFGSALAVGDFDCSGYADLAIGTPGESVGAVSQAGAAHVIFGSSTGLSTLDSVWYQGTGGVDGTPETNDWFGAALAAGNFDNDAPGSYGCDDLAIAAPNEDKDVGITTVVDSGYVYIIDGSSSGLSTASDQGIDQDVTDVADTAENYDQFGLRLEAVTLDEDSYDDLRVTVPGDGCLTSDGWGQHAFHGSSGGLSFSDDEVGCDAYGCTIDSGVYECSSSDRPIHGSSGGETISPHSWDDVVFGWGGADELTGSTGRDILLGGLGDDTLTGGAGGDLMIGGSGDDAFWLTLDCEIHADDVIDGGPGSDTVYSHKTATELASAGVLLSSIETFVSVSEDPSGRHDKCGALLELPYYNEPLNGSACILSHIPCEPSLATLELDTTTLVDYDADDRGDPAEMPPRMNCIDTTQFADDEYTLTLSATCPSPIGVVTDSLTVEIDNPTFKLTSVGTTSFEYHSEDIVTVEIDAGVSGLDVEVDFSAVDSEYEVDDETVIDNSDGTYTVSYALSASNTTPVGIYPLTVSLFDG